MRLALHLEGVSIFEKISNCSISAFIFESHLYNQSSEKAQMPHVLWLKFLNVNPYNCIRL